MKVIGIVGTRRRDEPKDIEHKIIEAFFNVYEEGDWIISGGCPEGADRFAELVAKVNQIPIMIVYAKWKKYGKVAGFIRNTYVAEHADILIACVSEDRTGGTEDTINKFLNYKSEDKLIIL